jgi:NifU-like protein
MAWEYTARTTQLFMDAVQGKPGTHLGEIDQPDGLGEHGSIACGDAMRFTFRVRRDPTDPTKDVITDARYLTFGCTSAIASSEALCLLLEEKEYTPLQALTITNADIVKHLGGLPKQKLHCSVMGAEALEAAVFNWSQRRDVDLKELGVELKGHDADEGRIVCQCFTVTEPYIKRKIAELELKTIEEITDAVKAGGACMSCHHSPGGLQDMLDGHWGPRRLKVKNSPAPPELECAAQERPPLSPYQFAKKVEEAIDEHVRPMLQKDGGDLEIIDIKDRMVYAKLNGACVGCAGAGMTLKLMVEETLKNRVDDRIKVIAL